MAKKKQSSFLKKFLKEAKDFNKKYQICRSCNGAGEKDSIDPISRKPTEIPCTTCSGKGFYPKY